NSLLFLARLGSGFGSGLGGGRFRGPGGRGLGSRRGRVLIGQGDHVQIGGRVGFIEGDLELFLLRVLDGDGFHAGGISGLGCGGPWRRGLLAAERHHAERDGPDGQFVPGLEGLLPEHPFAVDEGPVGTAQVADRELAPDLEELAMAAADLRRLDANQAIVVPAEGRDAVGQFEGSGGTAASDHLEYIIHRSSSRSKASQVLRCCRGDGHLLGYRPAAGDANGKPEPARTISGLPGDPAGHRLPRGSPAQDRTAWTHRPLRLQPTLTSPRRITLAMQNAISLFTTARML